MRIPLFVSASGILVVIAAGYAWSLWRMPSHRERPYLREWTRMWLALGLYSGFASVALLASTVDGLRPWRVAASFLSMLAAWWHLHALHRGMHALASPDRPRSRGTEIAVGLPIAIAIFILLVPAPADEGRAFALYLARVALLAVAWGVGYISAGVRIRRADAGPGWTRRAMGNTLLWYAALRLVEPLAFFVPEAPILAQLLVFGGIPIVVGIGAGMLMTLFEVERGLAVQALEERQAAERLQRELDRRDEWFRSLIENASDMIFQVTPDVRVEYASPSVRRILGYEPEALAGHNAFEFIHPDDAPSVADALRRSFAHDDTVPTVVPLRVRDTGGEYVPLEGVSRPYTDATGAERLIVSLRDVRERRRLEDELMAARRLEAIGRLAGGVAHDFNNLLTAVVGNVTLLRERTAGDGTATAHLDEINQSVRRGAELTKRLLAFARQQIIEPRVLAVAAQVADLERLLRRLLGDRVLLDLDLPTETWTIRADPTAFEQILVNLAVNARDAMPSGGLLRITTRNLSVGASGHETLNLAPGEWVRLDVSDTGTGIPAAVRHRVFEPFFTTKGGSGGTGLGLATVYGAVSQMGGQIRLDSEEGVGTTFSMFFPRVRAKFPTPPETATPTLPRAKPGESLLLMEDEAPVRDVTAKLLRRLGYQVLVAEDGETGVQLAAAASARLDIIVSDIMMPGIHGDAAVARIRETRPDIPVLFISGFSQEALRWTQGLPDRSRLLPKPFTLEGLAVAVREMLDGPGEVAAGDGVA